MVKIYLNIMNNLNCQLNFWAHPTMQSGSDQDVILALVSLGDFFMYNR